MPLLVRRPVFDGIIAGGVGVASRCARLARHVLWLGLAAVALHGARPYQPVSSDPLLESWRWRSFPELSGLDAQCVAAAPDGSLWFGTGDGLASYDGLEWHRELADNNAFIGWVAALCFQPDGSLVVGGWWGMSRFANGKWMRLFPPGDQRPVPCSEAPTDGSPRPRAPDVRKLVAAPDGTIWAATSWGALRWQGATWTLFTNANIAALLRGDKDYAELRIELLPDTVLAQPRPTALAQNRVDLCDVCVDARSAVWFGTRGGEVLRRAGDAWTLFNEADGLASGRLASLLARRDGALWVAHGAADAVSLFDGARWSTLPIPATTGPDSGKLLETRDGAVWLSARYMLLGYRDGVWRKYESPEIPLPLATNLLTQSPDGALWLVGPNTDVLRLDYQTPRWLTLRDLNFQWESPAGDEWFLHRDDRVVRHRGDTWTSYGVEDGLPAKPVALLGARDGVVWVAGSHDGVAATATFDGRGWQRRTHPDFAWGIDYRGVYEARDGSLWFGAAVDSSGPAEHRDGLLQFRAGEWRHHHQPGRSPRSDGAESAATLLPPSHRVEPIEKFVCLGESRDGKLWAGRNVLAYSDGQRWTEQTGDKNLRFGIIESMFTTREGDFWIGTRQYGALRYDGRTWSHFQDKDDLAANSVRSFAQTSDGSLWVATDRGVSRFDGQSWTAGVLPAAMTIDHESGTLKATPSGALWINRHTIGWNRRGWSKSPPVAPSEEFWTIRYRPSGAPPETVITSHVDRVSQPGNASILWRGTAAWREPADSHVQFSHRLDDRPWSPYTPAGGEAFFTLPAGAHHLAVRARDNDFNVDPTPATLDFVVLPPVWQQGWFIALLAALGGLIATQSVRVWLHQRRLRKAHGELEERVRQRTGELEAANRELEAFSYSVSHDLRAPLRSIDGFSKAVLEDYDAKLDDEGRDSLRRIRTAAQRMGFLIEALLGLSRVTRGPLRTGPVNLSALATELAADLAAAAPAQRVEIVIAPDLVATGDPALLRNVLQNLLGNAWKFTAGRPDARIEFGAAERAGQRAFFVRDNGAGFDRATAHNLFGAFQRYHTAEEFPGTGIGLATVRRIVHRHGGTVDAESLPGAGATFYFTLPNPSRAAPS
ncbi:MAG: hypothetical protein HYV96_05750 [Opitutae bacterium]|nr:hypothetical protein [Opitutae bacterium]